MTYNELLDLLNSYRLALTTMSFDTQTIAPKAGAPYRNKSMAILAGEYFKLLVSEKTYNILKETLTSGTDLEKKGAQELLKNLERTKNIPVDEYIAFEELVNNAQISWEKARHEKDYNLFKNDLEKLVKTHRKNLKYRGSDLADYDASLDDYEEGLRMEHVEKFFNTLESDLVPFIDTILENQGNKPAFLNAYVSIEKQKEISKMIMEHLCYKNEFGLLGEAAHPFSSTFSINDTRITTHYHENDFTQNIFSVIHEIGHSMYNHQVNPEFEGTPLADNMSMSMHESQSRFLENIIGRSKAFWSPIYSKLLNIIPDVLGSVSIEDFIKGINYVERGPIRIQADEVTYPLHIMVRYNIEKSLFNQDMNFDTLNEIFASEMTRLLGITPKDDSEGILQDVHWSGASFGYFPTYALGSAYAAQFYNAMKNSIDIDAILEAGELHLMFDWLKNNIHQYSGSIPTQELIVKVTGKSFNPKYYVDYIINKYSRLLGIDFE